MSDHVHSVMDGRTATLAREYGLIVVAIVVAIIATILSFSVVDLSTAITS